MRFFIPKAKVVFTHFRKAFIEVEILSFLDQEHYIRMKTGASGFAINRILSQLTLCHLIHINLNLSTSKISS